MSSLASAQKAESDAANYLAAKILSQVAGPNSHVPIEIFSQARAKDPPTDAFPRFVEAYCSCQRVATLTKGSYSGKLMDDWKAAISAAEKKPELVDIAPALSSVLAVKDDEELV